MAIHRHEEPYLVIEVRGGLVQAVHANNAVQYVIIDWDEIRERSPHLGETYDMPLIQEAVVKADLVRQVDAAIEANHYDLLIKILEGK